MRMTRLFRSKSFTLPGITTPANSSISAAELFTEPHKSTFSLSQYQYDTEEEEEEEDDEDTMEDEEDEEEDNTEYLSLRRKKNNSNNNNGNEGSPVMTSFNFIGGVEKGRKRRTQNNMAMNNPVHHPLLAIVLTALRKSLLVTCSVETDDDVSNHIDIGWPMDVRHVSHVTFDPFNGFLGLPLELQYDLPRKVPSASASVFGVSAQSMQCSYDNRGNCVPTILLMMQNRLYAEGGLQAEGIFRINADNSQEENVRNQLNRGVLPDSIDVHCLAGLIKAWFRELPTGVLDSLTPEQVMHCNTEEECTQLVKLLPSTEAALLHWAINLMADTVLHEHYNKMNARNIAMVFAPNMTQMADPLTALIHAVQVMNLLKTLIIKTLREREESNSRICFLSSTTHSPDYKGVHKSNLGVKMQCKQTVDEQCTEGSHTSKLSSSNRILECLESDMGGKWKLGDKSEAGKVSESFADRISPDQDKRIGLASSFRDRFGEEEADEGILDKPSLRKRVQKLCRHPVFQLSKQVKRKADTATVNSRGGGEAWI